jgi:ubiquinone/menaquinone biosynthesis C-methylase UbiE
MTRIGIGICALLCLWASLATSQDQHGAQNRDAIDRMRDRSLQPERVMDVIGLRPGMAVGEAGASYGYFTFKMSARVGPAGTVYANDIDADALRTIERRAASERIGNIATVLGQETDPRFPRNDLDMIVVFDCLFEFSQPAAWMKNARRYLKTGGRLVIVDPDPSKMSSVHFLSRQQVHDAGRQAGYGIVAVDDRFLESHMIVVLEAVRDPDHLVAGLNSETSTSCVWLRQVTELWPSDTSMQSTKCPALLSARRRARAGGRFAWS